jgi:hypothetical protein
MTKSSWRSKAGAGVQLSDALGTDSILSAADSAATEGKKRLIDAAKETRSPSIGSGR